MTRLSYDVTFNDTVIFNTVSYLGAKNFVESKGTGWGFKKVFTDFNPEDTPEHCEAMRKHAEKVQAVLTFKRELKHAPRYANISGVGPA